MKVVFSLFLFCFSCLTSFGQQEWKDVVVIDDLEVYVDVNSIEYKDGYYYAWVKTVFLTDASQKTYVDKIRNSYKVQDKKLDKKMHKWDNFYYNISYRKIDCLNKSYQVLEVTDYTVDDEKIIKTKPSKKGLRWVNVGIDTMGDYTLYFICDSDSE